MYLQLLQLRVFGQQPRHHRLGRFGQQLQACSEVGELLGAAMAAGAVYFLLRRRKAAEE